MDTKELIQLIDQMEQTIVDHEQELTDLDATIGDGDHGLNLAKGFKAVKEKLDQSDLKTPSDVLKVTGMTLVSTVGGASGPLYGTAFMQMSMVVKGKDCLTKDDLLPLLEAAISGIQKRGKAEIKEKTMLYMLVPYVQQLKEIPQSEWKNTHRLLLDSLKKAEANIMEMKATKGRASYLGERSQGHMDPGAKSMEYLLEVLTKAVK